MVELLGFKMRGMQCECFVIPFFEPGLLSVSLIHGTQYPRACVKGETSWAQYLQKVIFETWKMDLGSGPAKNNSL